MNRTIAPIGAGILVATLMSACRPQYPAPDEELRESTKSLRRYGVTITVPADLREDALRENVAAWHRSYRGADTWAGLRAWVRIEACAGVSDPGSCRIGTTGFVERPSVRVGGAEIRRFESLEANRPRGVVWVTPDGGTSRTVVFVIGRSLGDSALVRRMANTVQPSPE